MTDTFQDNAFDPELRQAGENLREPQNHLDDEELGIIMSALTNESRALYLGSISMLSDEAASGFTPAHLFHRMQYHENGDEYANRFTIDSSLRQTLIPYGFVERTSTQAREAHLHPTTRGLYTGLYAGHTLEFSLRHDISMHERFLAHHASCAAKQPMRPMKVSLRPALS